MPPPRPFPPSNGKKRRWQRAAIGCYRIGLVVAALALLRAQPKPAVQPDRAKILAESQAVLSSTKSLGDPSDGLFPLLDSRQETIGWATTTNPQAQKIQGYSGPSEALVILDANRSVKAVRLLASADTTAHVQKIRDDPQFWNQWTGKSEASLGANPTPRLVTGASLTSQTIARGIAARFGAQGMDEWFPQPLSLPEIAQWFPAADRIDEISKTPGRYQIRHGEKTLGSILRSSRMGVSARGFNGTSDVILALDPTGKTLLGVALLASRDNQPYVGDVQQELKFADGFAGKSTAEIFAADPENSAALLVSGASFTATAVIATVHEMLRREQAEAAAHAIPWKTYAAITWIALGLLAGFAKGRHAKKIRLAFAVLSVIAGISLGWLVSQDQLIGWGSDGLDPRAALPLLLLTAVALVVPAFTGKNIYCSRICPHGAAQTLAGQVINRRFHLPPKLHALLNRVPWLLLLTIWALAFLASGLPFSYFEPFEMWSSGFVAFVPATIFTVGLLAAFFLPQAYCHYGCPTGALLRFLTSAPGRWTTKDSTAGTLLLLAAVVTASH
jgi:Na+-translocating ferredoxin:NAD+ oxidoreductase RnfG subunit